MLTFREEDIDAAVRAETHALTRDYYLVQHDRGCCLSCQGLLKRVRVRLAAIYKARAAVSQAARTLASARKPSKTAKLHAELAKAVGR